MTITAAVVKDLREKTGAGMMDCKKALSETNGDMEAAVDWLRKKGLSKAAKKAGRVAAQGLISVAINETSGAVIEVNSETDFVARNEQFQEFVKNVSSTAIETNGNIDTLKETKYPGSGKTIADELTERIATIGEHMDLRRSEKISVNNGTVTSYIHSATAPNMGAIGVLVAIESDGDKEQLNAIGKQIAMHIAATNPLCVNIEDIDAKTVEKEREVFKEQAKASGKPDNVIEKMVEGRIRKFYEEVVLLEQAFVIDPNKKVKDALNDLGFPAKITKFVRFALGEGIEKKEEDFAAEVAATAKG